VTSQTEKVSLKAENLEEAERALPRPVRAKGHGADRSAAGFDLSPSFSRAQVFGELMFPDDAVVRLVRMADPILRLIGSMGEEGDDRVPSVPGPARSVLGITDVLARGIAMLIHQTSSFVM
jgi:hypothetical protein